MPHTYIANNYITCIHKYDIHLKSIITQQTKTRDFTCSVSEFTSSAASIHVNSPHSVNKYGVSIRVSREITSVSSDDTYQWKCISSDPVQHVSNSGKNSWQQAEHMYSHEYIWNTYWWSGTNYEPVWHQPTVSKMVPCLLGNLSIKVRVNDM